MDPGLWEVFEAAGPDEVQAIIRLADPTVVPAGVRLVAQFGDIITCRLSRQAIVEVRTSGATASMKPAVRLLEEPDQSTTPAADTRQDIQRRPASITQTGNGVVLGFVDWGLDFTHPDFRKEDGTTRLIALWDQQNDGKHPVNNPYGYGRVHRSEEINRALGEKEPYAALGYLPSDADVDHSGTHGTHVAGIAAGNGRAGGPLGLAPDADIVFVHLGGEGPAALASLGNSVTLLEAVDFIARTAGDKPWVINLSLGQQGGSHDGTSLAEQALDNLISDAPGRAIAQSCGNYCNRRIHAAGKLRPGEERTLHFDVANTELVPNKVEIWYSKRDRITVSVGLPDGTTSEVVGQGERELLTTAGKPIGRLYHRAHDPNNGDHQIALFIYPDSPGGQWTMKLMGEDVLDGRFNAWAERNTFCLNCQPHFVPHDAVELSTTGTICNGYRTIAVGAYNAHSAGRELAPFSSWGPTADGRVKPDLVAPGVNVVSARSSPGTAEPADLLTSKSGTSMASPHVAGTLALMFEAAGKLPIDVSRRILLASTEKVDGQDDFASGLGSGYLDTARAVEASIEHSRTGRSTAEQTEAVADHGVEEKEMEEEADVETTITRPVVEAEARPEPLIQSEPDVVEPEAGEAVEGYQESDLLEAVRRIPFGPEADTSPIVGKYEVVIGGLITGLIVRDRLAAIAQSLAGRRDLKWAFPHVYSLVTNDVVFLAERHGFRYPDAVLHWIANFYELYALNLRSWLQTGKAEAPWATAFADPARLDPRFPWGARSAAAFILGMFAHIRSDLPRALSYVYLKLYQGRTNPTTSGPYAYEDFKSDFDVMNEKVFPAVIEKVAAEGIVLPSASELVPARILDGYVAMRTHLAQEREDAWRFGWIYASNPAVQKAVAGFTTKTIPLFVELGKPGKPTEAGLESAALEALEATAPSDLFQAFALGRRFPELEAYRDQLEVVAPPGGALTQPLREGDLLVRVAEAGPGHLALIAEPATIKHGELSGRGFTSEIARPGYYATVVEPGPRLHVHADRFARLITDAEGRVPHDQVLLRVKPRDIPFEAAAAAPPDSTVANRFVEAHSSRFCMPGQPGSGTCAHLVSPRVVRSVVIHTLAVPSTHRESGADAVVRAWQSPGRAASAHYIVDRNGQITQMVREANVAFHVVDHNAHTIGIEHADVCNDPAPYTTELYERSSELVRDVARRNGFTPNDRTVVGHSSIRDHHDPGPYWDWDYYYFLLQWDHRTRADRPIRHVVSVADRSAPTGWRVQRRRRIAYDMCATSNDPWGHGYWEAEPAHDATPVELEVALDEPGIYRVSLWWPHGPDANPAVPVELSVACRHHGCGDDHNESGTLNQQRNSGRWNDVGATITIHSPVTVQVRIRRDSAATGWIRADAMRVLKVGSAARRSGESVPEAQAPITVESVRGSEGVVQLEETAEPPSRTCCMLASAVPFGRAGSAFVEASSLGNHGTSTEVTGLVYTGQAGFVDLGHLRDLVDLTKYIYDQIAAAAGAPASVKTKHGVATFFKPVPAADWMNVAKAIAYDDSYGYEIWTYWIPAPGAHNSSFSPEDLPSNNLGTIVAERALKRGAGSFNASVTTEIKALLTSLDAQIPAESLKAFNRINHRWVEFGSTIDLGRNSFLRRRNFDRAPWKTGHPSDGATPSWVLYDYGTAPTFYQYVHTYQRSIPKLNFAIEVAAIRADASNASKYGPDYDKP